MVLSSLISYYYYLRVVWKMYFEEGTEHREWPRAASRSVSRLAICAIGGILTLGLFPGPALRAFERAGADLESAPPAEQSSADSLRQHPPATERANPGEPLRQAHEGTRGRTSFREYDIRGIVGETLDPDLARAVGLRLLGASSDPAKRWPWATTTGHSSPDLASALIEGLNASGVDVLLVGDGPDAGPLLRRATYELETDGGIQITGSHNPPEYNGIKMLTLGGRPLYGAAIQALRARIEADELASGAGTAPRGRRPGPVRGGDRAASASVEPPIRFVLDCGNGAGSVVAARAAPCRRRRGGSALLRVRRHLPESPPRPHGRREREGPHRPGGLHGMPLSESASTEMRTVSAP